MKLHECHKVSFWHYARYENEPRKIICDSRYTYSEFTLMTNEGPNQNQTQVFRDQAVVNKLGSNIKKLQLFYIS